MDVREKFTRLRSCAADLHTRVRAYFDHKAEQEKAAWGSHMEYKRRYTNPDDAKRARVPPGDFKL